MKRSRVLGRALGAVGLVIGTTATGVGGSAVIGVASASASVPASGPISPSTTCQLGNGIQHVVQIAFDNVHFNRDNPNVPSDLEQLPALTSFLEGNGTLNSNNHTPLIAHTADDTLTTYTGLYGDRQGQGVTNDYEVFNSNQTVDSAASFAYWTAPIDDTSSTSPQDTKPSMIYSSQVPAQAVPNAAGDSGVAEAPAPWVPFTRAGCDVGNVSTANQVLENVTPDIATVFGPTSPEEAQATADSDSFKDQETADYVGLAVHCASGDAICANAQAVKFGQTTPSPSAVADKLPTEPGGYNGFQVLFGHKYIAPVLGAGTANVTRTAGGHTYPVTDAAGNLTDLFGNELDGDFISGPGFPGFGPITAAQSLGYTADMLESGIPITYAYIGDLHERKFYPSGYKTTANNVTSTSSPPTCTTAGAKTGWAVGPGDPCFEYNATQWNNAFATFFQRLADDGINKSNTLFIVTADEGDHFAGANVGRSIAPTCTGTPGVASDTPNPPVGSTPYTCSYPTGTLGEVETSLHGLVKGESGDATSTYYVEPQGWAIYDSGTTNARTVEQEMGAATVNDPYTGNANTPVANYLADPNEEALLHYADADPNRTPSFTVFPQGDLYADAGTTDSPACATTGSPNVACSVINSQYAWNHGYYVPEINNTWLGIAGPGVANNGLDGNGPAAGPSSAGGASGTGTTPANGQTGTWADHTDTRPTMMFLAGLKDDYIEDGRVLVEDMTPTVLDSAEADPNFKPLAVCYKQLNSSVGQFGTDTLEADTTALKSNSAGDATYTSFQSQLATLGANRDALATQIKGDLYNAEFSNTPLPNGPAELAQCTTDLAAADALAAGQPPPALPESPFSAALPAVVALVGLGVVTVVVRRRRNVRNSIV